MLVFQVPEHKNCTASPVSAENWLLTKTDLWTGPSTVTLVSGWLGECLDTFLQFLAFFGPFWIFFPPPKGGWPAFPIDHRQTQKCPPRAVLKKETAAYGCTIRTRTDSYIFTQNGARDNSVGTRMTWSAQARSYALCSNFHMCSN